LYPVFLNNSIQVDSAANIIHLLNLKLNRPLRKNYKRSFQARKFSLLRH
jgi:hypothetical protein